LSPERVGIECRDYRVSPKSASPPIAHADHACASAVTRASAPFRETAATIALRRAAGILAVEMEAAALYAFAAACRRPVICLAHVSNQLGCVEGDFEKGEANGAATSLALVTALAQAWSARAAWGDADFGETI
jgi:hypothetical protein